MPCDIGYKNISLIRVEQKLPQEFKERVAAPKPDESLLDNLGVEDAAFLEWVSSLDITPLLQEALRRALTATDNAVKAIFVIRNGELEIRSSYAGVKEKKALEALAKIVAERFQIATLGIIAQLLDYKIVFSEQVVGGKRMSVLEGEKEESASIHKYLKISLDADGEGVLAFEHFESPASLDKELAMVAVLAKKFGVKIRISEKQRAGQPIPSHAEHRDFLKQGG